MEGPHLQHALRLPPAPRGESPATDPAVVQLQLAARRVSCLQWSGQHPRVRSRPGGFGSIPVPGRRRHRRMAAQRQTAESAIPQAARRVLPAFQRLAGRALRESARDSARHPHEWHYFEKRSPVRSQVRRYLTESEATMGHDGKRIGQAAPPRLSERKAV